MYTHDYYIKNKAKFQESNRRYYKKHRSEYAIYRKTDIYKKNHYEANKRLRLSQRERLDKLKERPCTDCHKRFPPCAMDFDHIRGKKDKCVGYLRARRLNILLNEIAKCELVCSNCHRIRTQRRLEEI